MRTIGYTDDNETDEYVEKSNWAGIITGLVVTDIGGGSVNISDGRVVLKNTNTDDDDSAIYTLAAVNYTPTSDQITYIYATKTGFSYETSLDSSDFNTKVLISKIHYDGAEMNIDTGARLLYSNMNGKILNRIYETEKVARVSGLDITNPSALTLQVGSGIAYIGLIRQTFTSVSTWSYWYGNETAGFTKILTQTSLNASQYDVNGVLTSLTGYRCDYVYIDTENQMHVVLGKGDYISQALAEDENVPSSTYIPRGLRANGILCGKVIVDGTVVSILSAFEESFTSGGGGVSDHGALTGLSDDDHTHYFNSTRLDDGTLTHITTNYINNGGGNLITNGNNALGAGVFSLNNALGQANSYIQIGRQAISDSSLLKFATNSVVDWNVGIDASSDYKIITGASTPLKINSSTKRVTLTGLGVGMDNDETAALQVYNSANVPVDIYRYSTTGNTCLRALELFRTTGTSGNGIGCELAFRPQDSGGNPETTAVICGMLNDITNGAEQGTLRFSLCSDSALFTALNMVASTGNSLISTFTGSVRTSTAPSNGDDLCNKTYVDGAGYWSRTGTVLSPKTSGDSVYTTNINVNGDYFYANNNNYFRDGQIIINQTGSVSSGFLGLNRTSSSGLALIKFQTGNVDKFIMGLNILGSDMQILNSTTTNTILTLGTDDSVALKNGTSITEFSTDGTLAGNSDDAVPTEKAVKTYVDGLNYWDRTGTILSPKTAGDSLYITSINAAGGNLLLNNCNQMVQGQFRLNNSDNVSDADLSLNRQTSAGSSSITLKTGNTNAWTYGIFGGETNMSFYNSLTSNQILFLNTDDSIKLKNGTSIDEFSTDGTLAGDSDDAVPTEKAVKAYVDKFWTDNTTYISSALPIQVTGTIQVNGNPTNGDGMFFADTTGAGDWSKYVLGVAGTAKYEVRATSSATGRFQLYDNTNDQAAIEIYASTGGIPNFPQGINIDSAGSATLNLDRAANTDTANVNFKTGGTQQFNIGFNDTVHTLDFTSGSTTLMKLFQGGTIWLPYTYGSTVTSARDLQIQSDGKIGYVSSILASKTNISSLGDITWLKKLRPVTFNYRVKDDLENYTDEAEDDLNYGLIAEEVEKVNKELVFYDKVEGKNELRGVSYGKLIIPLLKMVQMLCDKLNM